LAGCFAQWLIGGPTISSRHVLATALALSLGSDTSPARVAAVGVVSHADRAYIGEALVSSGTTVYDGDRLSTEVGGVLRLNTGTTALHLAPQTIITVRLTGPGQNTEVELATGTLVVSSAKNPAISVRANDACIRPATNAPTVAHIRVVNRKELRLSAERGSLQFSYEGESAVIPEGVAYRVLLDPQDDPSSAPAGGQPGTKPGKVPKPFLLIAIAAAAAVAVVLDMPHFESPDRPGTSPQIK
jgi:hypothetical protein